MKFKVASLLSLSSPSLACHFIFPFHPHLQISITSRLLGKQKTSDTPPPPRRMMMMMMKVVSLLLLPTLVSSFAGRSTTTMMSVQQLTVGNGKTNVIAGATGYIGKSVVRESVRQGYKTIALVRDKSKVESAEGKLMYGGYFEGAELVECDVCNPSNVEQVRCSI